MPLLLIRPAPSNSHEIIGDLLFTPLQEDAPLKKNHVCCCSAARRPAPATATMRIKYSTKRDRRGTTDHGEYEALHSYVSMDRERLRRRGSSMYGLLRI